MSRLTEGQVLSQRWHLHRGALLQLLDRLPESAGAVRGWPGGMTTLQLANHIADQADEMMGGALGLPPTHDQPATSLAAVRNRLYLQSQRIETALDLCPAESLRRVVQLSRLKLTAPAGELIQLHIQHESYHCGQLTYHARLAGIDPPYFVRNLWAFAHRTSSPGSPPPAPGIEKEDD